MLSQLSNEELTAKLEMLRGNERSTTLEIIYHLMELDRRGYYRELGYSSLFYYCTKKLGYSEASASRRIAGARCIRDNLELSELFLHGKVNLCTIATAAVSIAEKVTQVEEIVGKSKREVEILVARAHPLPKPRETIKPLVVAPAPVLPLFSSPMEENPPLERVKLSFSVPKETYHQYEEVRARLSNALGSELTLEAVFTRLLKSYLKPVASRAQKDTNPHSRYIPRAMRRQVHEACNGRCTYEADGTRCGETHYLEVDHIVPFAKGGRTELSNLRLLCRAHNQLLAEKEFPEFFLA